MRRQQIVCPKAYTKMKEKGPTCPVSFCELILHLIKWFSQKRLASNFHPVVGQGDGNVCKNI